MIRDNKGITLIALAITIIVLIIIAGIVLNGGNNSIKMTKSNKMLADLDIVQHACLERYTEYKLTKNESILKGTVITYSEAQNVASSMEINSLSNEGVYYELNPEDLKSLGLSESEDTYIVNYEKGIVMNKTTKQTPNGDNLYKDTNN